MLSRHLIRRPLVDSLRETVVALAGLLRAPLLRHHRVIVIGLHLVAPIATTYVAFLLRFDGSIPDVETGIWWRTLPFLFVIRALTFGGFRLYEGLWRYTSIWDLKNLATGIGVGSVLFYAVVHGYFGILEYPRSVFIIDAMLLLLALGGLRLLPRVYRELVRQGRGKRMLIFGAGDAGEMIVRDMLKDADYQPVGFLDDDARKIGKRIHGVPVIGSRADLPRAIAVTRPDEVLLAVSRRDLQLMRDLVFVLQPFKVPITTLPAMRLLIDGKVTVNQIRKVSIEDLLPRAPIGLDTSPVRDLIRGKCVMVTGAGGSIGSELCRQIAAFGPSMLVMYERYENSLYTVAHDLQELAPTVRSEAIIGDVTDERRLTGVMATYRPEIVLHAAAHKHVPLMEQNCCEAIKNNVVGTRLVAEAAQRYGAELFLLISSDKAVNPSSVMGATKRVAELIVQSMPTGRTRCTTVRFGNVLGSNGSVVPRFLQQIQAGGPVTVTHPEIRRYFMLIPEAVQLVLHAAALGTGNDVYVLDMGEQIKLVDLAQNLIRLSGFVPEQEIPIEYVGLRPGEKLYEELMGTEEAIESTAVEKVLRVSNTTATSSPWLRAEVALLTKLAWVTDAEGVIKQLCKIVPSFRPDFSVVQRSRPVRGRQRMANMRLEPGRLPQTRTGLRPS